MYFLGFTITLIINLGLGSVLYAGGNKELSYRNAIKNRELYTEDGYPILFNAKNQRVLAPDYIKLENLNKSKPKK